MNIERKEELIHFIDVAPAADYPIRILKAHLHNHQSCRWDGFSDDGSAADLARTLNAEADRRCVILRNAIETLERAKK